MGIDSLTAKLSRFCEASSTQGIGGLSSDFHAASHGSMAMEKGLGSILDAHAPERPSVFKGPKL